MKNTIKKIFTLSALAFAALSSQAATTTANFNATATLNQSCVVAVDPVSFGAITPAATGTQSTTGTITSTCSNGVAYDLLINKGSSGDANRSMAGTNGNTDKLNYNLYINSSYVNVWGDGTFGTLPSGVGTGVSQQQNFYAQLPLNQYIKSDTYTDTLTLTLRY